MFGEGGKPLFEKDGLRKRSLTSQLVREASLGRDQRVLPKEIEGNFDVLWECDQRQGWGH